MGSSPRMRGAPRLWRGHGVKVWIIPADAGSTRPENQSKPTHRDHPRGCGEHGAGDDKPYAGLGSSPRMRGAQPLLIDLLGVFGIIPADAGSTGRGAAGYWADPDHPRGCGEHTMRISLVFHQAGSSPRMRGAPLSPRPSTARGGIIPADAGSTAGVAVGAKAL